MQKNELEVMAQKAEQKKVTLEQLLAKAKTYGEIKTKDIYIKSLEADLTIKQVKEELIYSGLNRITESKSDMETVMDVAGELIYNACDILKSKELQEAFECVEPYDIVKKVLTASERSILYAQILVLSGFEDDDINTLLKNV